MDRSSGRVIRRLCAVALSLAMATSFSAPTQAAEILELKDVQFFKATVISDSPATLRVSGLALHSALSVQGITTLRHGAQLQLLVPLKPASLGGSGNFDHTLAIPDDIAALSFGKDRVVIWDRTSGVLQPSPGAVPAGLTSPGIEARSSLDARGQRGVQP